MPFLYSLVSEFLSPVVSRVYSRVYSRLETPVSHSPPHIYRIRALPLIHSRDTYILTARSVVWATHTAQGREREFGDPKQLHLMAQNTPIVCVFLAKVVYFGESGLFIFFCESIYIFAKGVIEKKQRHHSQRYEQGGDL